MLNSPKICIRSRTIIVQVGNVESLRVENRDVARPQSMSESLELGQNSRLRNIEIRSDGDFAKVDLKKKEEE